MNQYKNKEWLWVSEGTIVLQLITIYYVCKRTNRFYNIAHGEGKNNTFLLVSSSRAFLPCVEELLRLDSSFTNLKINASISEIS